MLVCRKWHISTDRLKALPICGCRLSSLRGRYTSIAAIPRAFVRRRRSGAGFEPVGFHAFRRLARPALPFPWRKSISVSTEFDREARTSLARYRVLAQGTSAQRGLAGAVRRERNLDDLVAWCCRFTSTTSAGDSNTECIRSGSRTAFDFYRNRDRRGPHVVSLSSTKRTRPTDGRRTSRSTSISELLDAALFVYDPERRLFNPKAGSGLVAGLRQTRSTVRDLIDRFGRATGGPSRYCVAHGNLLATTCRSLFDVFPIDPMSDGRA